ncbi:MAG: penicillin-binding protein 2 [Pseudomonadota bacterium]
MHNATKFQVRFTLAKVGITLALVVLLIRLAYLQIYCHEQYQGLSQNNHLRLQPAIPTRGIIYDRYGTVLANSQAAYKLDITRELTTRPIPELLVEIAKLVGFTQAEQDAFWKAWKNSRSFQPVTVKSHLTPAERDRFAVNQYRFDGCTLTVNPLRYYPYNDVFSHVLGYVAKVSEEDRNKNQLSPLSQQVMVGRTALEQYYEPELRGELGFNTVHTDAHGRPIETQVKQAALPGANLILTLDAAFQEHIYKLLQGKRASVVALDPRNGEILAFISVPGYNPNDFVHGIDPKTLNLLSQNPSRPLFHRALKGRYPLASTIKPFLGLGALEHKIVTPEEEIFDPGWYELPNDKKRYRDMLKPKGHGRIRLQRAIAESCDTYFYHLAHKMKMELMAEWIKRFGFGHVTGVDLPEEPSGLVPTPSWKRKTKHEPWYPGETIISGIGQGYYLTTPLQLACAAGMMANQGIGMRPHLVREVDYFDGHKQVIEPIITHTLGLSQLNNWQLVVNGMEDVVKDAHGTAHRIQRKGYRIAGKTGTAQVFSLKEGQVYDASELAEHLRDHSMFICFGPLPKPIIALAIIVENNRGASDVAGQALEWYFTHRGMT